MLLSRVLLASVAALAGAAGAQAEWDACLVPSVSWVAHDDAEGRSMAYALAGTGSGVWVAGTFRKTLALRGPGGTASTQGASDEDDVFLARLSATGSPTALQSFGGSGRELILDIAEDDAAGVLALAGYFKGALTLVPPGTAAADNAKDSHFDGFVSAMRGGVVAWTQTIAGTRESKLFGVTAAGGRVAAAGYTCDEDLGAAVDPQTGRRPDTCSAVVVEFAAATGTELSRRLFANLSLSGLRYDAPGERLFVTGTLSGALPVPELARTLRPVPSSSSQMLVASIEGGVLRWATTLGARSGWDLDLAGGVVYASGSSLLAALAADSGAVRYERAVKYSRGIRVSKDGSSVYLMGLAENGFFDNGHSLGSSDVFLAKVRASDGAGLWALDLGGGAAREYPWSLSLDARGDAYVSGLSFSTALRFGDEEARGLPSEDYSMFVVKVATSQEALPPCKASCTELKPGFCFIANQCFAEGASPFAGGGCFHCKPRQSTSAWTGPDLSDHCLIDGACVPHGQFKGAGSTLVSQCEYCRADRNATGWTLHAGFKDASCALDDDVVVPGCAPGQVRNEAFCGAQSPCFDSATDQCHEAVRVCPEGHVYTDQCPDFPVETCYSLSQHQCAPPGGGEALAPATRPSCPAGAFYTGQCPATHPCFRHVDLACVRSASQDATPSTAPPRADSRGHQLLLLTLLPAALALTFRS